MGAVGTFTVNFGAFPGTDQATVSVTGQSGITSGSRCEAWVDPTLGGTTDHSVGEHVLLEIDTEVSCEAIVAGTGFTIVVSSVSGLQYGQVTGSWVWI